MRLYPLPPPPFPRSASGIINAGFVTSCKSQQNEQTYRPASSRPTSSRPAFLRQCPRRKSQQATMNIRKTKTPTKAPRRADVNCHEELLLNSSTFRLTFSVEVVGLLGVAVKLTSVSFFSDLVLLRPLPWLVLFRIRLETIMFDWVKFTDIWCDFNVTVEKRRERNH